MKRFKSILAATIGCIVIACAVVMPASAAQADLTTHIATVSASALRLRSGPSTESSTLDYAANGEYVRIKGKTGSWYQVSYNLTDGYMHESHLLLHDAKNVELGFGRVSGNKVNIRSGPGTSYTAVARGNAGDKAYVIGFNRQWYKVIYGDKIGYIRSDYLQLTEIPYENKDSTKAPIFFIDGKSTGITPSANALSVGGSSTASKIVATAKQYIGVPYVWGGSSPSGFDCSGFTRYVFNKHGVALPRTTDQQYKVGSYVSRSNLKAGDLVFLQNTYREGISHVGIYIGDGKMIHASSSKGIVISDLSSSYYTKHYYGARRVL